MFSQTSQPCQFERDCTAVMIPAGDEVTLPAGTVGYITQSLGGSFTVFVDGNLFRVAGIDADAIDIALADAARELMNARRLAVQGDARTLDALEDALSAIEDLKPEHLPDAGGRRGVIGASGFVN